MGEGMYHILLSGPREIFHELFDHLEANKNYDLRYASDFQSARGLLWEHRPSAVVLGVAPDEQNTQAALAWLDTVKNLAPVLVLVPARDAEFYMTVMEHGALDYFTRCASVEEIDSELNDIITWDYRQAA